MIEKFPTNFEKPAEEKKSEQVLEFENLELAGSKEKELREGFAKELKKPYEGSYFKKLQRIAGAFALAGLMTIAVPEKAISPEKSKEFKELETLDYYHKTDPFRYLDVLTALQKKVEEKGGIDVSPQLPGEVYKPKELYRMVQLTVGSPETPYFSKPEIIFGEEFIKKNPEKAKEYFERVSKTQKATVIITNKTGMGSGVIINTEKGKLILTNEHVVRGNKNVWVKLINGNTVEAKVLNIDKKYDTAILKIDLPEDIIKEKKVLEGTNSLDLDPDVKLKTGENLALIGHPLGYPFEVSLAKLENVESELVQEENQSGFIATKIFSKPDERFVKLAAYETGRKWEEGGAMAYKGETIWGMSGGPMIKLDEKGEPRLIGINMQRHTVSKDIDPLSPYSFREGIGPHAAVIKYFLEKSGYPATVAVSK